MEQLPLFPKPFTVLDKLKKIHKEQHSKLGYNLSSIEEWINFIDDIHSIDDFKLNETNGIQIIFNRRVL